MQIDSLRSGYPHVRNRNHLIRATAQRRREILFTGSYLINADCTVTVTIQDDLGEVLQEEGVILPDGREFRFIETNPGMLVARVARRLSE